MLKILIYSLTKILNNFYYKILTKSWYTINSFNYYSSLISSNKVKNLIYTIENPKTFWKWIWSPNPLKWEYKVIKLSKVLFFRFSTILINASTLSIDYRWKAEESSKQWIGSIQLFNSLWIFLLFVFIK